MDPADSGDSINDDQLSYAQHDQRQPLWRRLQEALDGPHRAKPHNKDS